ncbi:MAG: ABC transporter substrate-binding protein [Pseudomonadota bacterium]
MSGWLGGAGRGAVWALVALAAAPALLGYAAVWEPRSAAPAAAPERPLRIVSLDYCADQYVLRLVEPDRILALSPDATKPFSYMRAAAVGVPTVRPVAEDVLALKPDLVVRAYGGGPNAAWFYERAGAPVLQVGWASDIDSAEIGSVVSVIAAMAEGLGAQAEGAAVIAEYRARLAALTPRARAGAALYLTPSGVTTGPGSLVHEMMTAAGLTNFETEPGWRPLPLERLAYEQPDVTAAASFGAGAHGRAIWSAARHPVARAQLDGPEVVPLEGAWTACGAWFLMDAVEALAAGAATAAARPRAQGPAADP